MIEAARAVARDGMARREDLSATASKYYRRAVVHMHHAAKLKPYAAQPWRHAAIALRELGDLHASERALAHAAHIAPGDADICVDLAFARQSLGQTDAAIALFEEVLARHPDHANAHASLALSLLGSRDFGRGWDEYEWRRRVAASAIERAFPFPEWRGEPLDGATLFIYSEQGIGDEIMFASCFADLIARSGHCVVECSRRLVGLFRDSFPRATVVARDRKRMPNWQTLPRIDVQIPAGSVPRFLRRTAATFPGTPYLVADPAAAARWRSAFATRPGELRVGIAWSGGLPDTLRASRSLDAAALKPLCSVPSVRFFCLELVDRTSEIAALTAATGVRIEYKEDLAAHPGNAAALISTLDLVISVPTAVAHIAGALGVAVWVLVNGTPTWRYGWSGDRSPWYGSMRILRRTPEEDVSDLLGRVAGELAKTAARNPPASAI